MVVAALLALGLAVVGGWIALMALLGRSTFPARERISLRQWTFADLRANALRGITALGSVDAAAHGVRVD